MKTKCCSKCWEYKSIHEFYSDSITGWSGLCMDCRDKRDKAAKKRKERQQREAIARMVALKEKHEAQKLQGKIKLLEKEYKRFTLSNRTQLKQLHKKFNERGATTKLVNAITRRTEMQEKAQQLFDYQVEQIKKGITPQTIYELWRTENGDDTGKESQEADYTTA